MVPGHTRAGVQLGHLVRSLARHNTVDVLVVRSSDQPYVERMGNARLLRVPIHASSLDQQVNAFRRALWRQIEGAEYDIVHFRDGWSGIPVLELRERFHFLAVFDVGHGPTIEPHLGADLGAELARDEEACLLDADLVLAPTESARRYIAARGRPDRVFAVPPGVDVNQFDFEHPYPGPPRVLYLGVLAPGRGLRILLRAVFDLASRSSAHLTLAGPSLGGFDQRLQSVVNDLDLGDRVELVGPIDHEDVPSVIARASICVVPRAVDLTPNPTLLYPTRLLEFMACRRVVVAPRESSVSLLVKDGVHGLLFTPNDHADLTLKLMRLIGNPGLREKLAAAGYEEVRRHHTAGETRRCLRRAYAALAVIGGEERYRVSWGGGYLPELVTPHSPPLDPNITTELHDHDLVEATPADASGLPDYDELAVVADDVTTVDVKDRSWVDRARTAPRSRIDEWVVADSNANRVITQLTELGDEGTPVDIAPVTISATLLENRFVAGELEVPTPPPEVHDPAFSAVSVLLGSDGTSETPTPTPTSTPTPTPIPIRRRRMRRSTPDE